MRNQSLILIGVLACGLTAVAQSSKPPARWSAERANAWYKTQPWLVGANYIPATAINQLEMWQADTFDPKRIDLELGWAESIGMNTMRVFLHDLLWQQDEAGFRKRIDTFLDIAAKHHIRPQITYPRAEIDGVFAAMAAFHALEYHIIPRLQTHMNMRHQARFFPNQAI